MRQLIDDETRRTKLNSENKLPIVILDKQTIAHWHRIHGMCSERAYACKLHLRLHHTFDDYINNKNAH